MYWYISGTPWSTLFQHPCFESPTYRMLAMSHNQRDLHMTGVEPREGVPYYVFYVLDLSGLTLQHTGMLNKGFIILDRVIDIVY